MIGDRIRQARAALKLSQEEAAEAAKIPLGSVRKYEQGSSKPGSDALASLSTLGINANWLLTGEGPMLVANTMRRGSHPPITSPCRCTTGYGLQLATARSSSMKLPKDR